MDAWKKNYQPIPIGRRLVIVPAWLDSPDPARLAIKIDPGMAFGTGTHPTTQLCLEYIEEYLGSSRPGSEPTTVMDIGCGSGILSIGALILGATFALGVDIDEAAIRASRENALLNGINVVSFELGIGSLEEILAGYFKVAQASIVLANILAPVLVQLFGIGLAQVVAPGGSIVLSGILKEQGEEVKRAADESGLLFSGEKQMGDWVALCYTRK
jgi:ribosomal protein L11 methyltransferase